jgi:hypothetical protein
MHNLQEIDLKIITSSNMMKGLVLLGGCRKTIFGFYKRIKIILQLKPKLYKYFVLKLSLDMLKIWL